MESRTLEINISSAKDLKNVNIFSKMSVYVVVSVSGDWTSQKTAEDKNGGRNPTWNHPMKFTVDASAAEQNRLTVNFRIRSKRVFGDRDVGEVNVPVKELLDAKDDDKMKLISFQVRRPSGKPKGELSFSFKFSEKFTAAPAPSKASEPVMAYPAQPSGYGKQPAYAPQPSGYGNQSAYPPQAAGYGYQSAYPPTGAYGYAPPPYQGGYGAAPPGYGYPPGAVHQPGSRMGGMNGMGMGLGMGLLGGMAGGMLINDMVSDDAGFGDGGFGDGGFF